MKRKSLKRAVAQGAEAVSASRPARVYASIPCMIGYKYLRLQVDGTVLPCCVSSIDMGSIADGRTVWDVWFSDRYAAFREKTSRIAVDQFHLTDPDWSFCLVCPHIAINEQAAREQTTGSKPRRRRSK